MFKRDKTFTSSRTASRLVTGFSCFQHREKTRIRVGFACLAGRLRIGIEAVYIKSRVISPPTQISVDPGKQYGTVFGPHLDNVSALKSRYIKRFCRSRSRQQRCKRHNRNG